MGQNQHVEGHCMRPDGPKYPLIPLVRQQVGMRDRDTQLNSTVRPGFAAGPRAEDVDAPGNQCVDRSLNDPGLLRSIRLALPEQLASNPRGAHLERLHPTVTTFVHYGIPPAAILSGK